MTWRVASGSFVWGVEGKPDVETEVIRAEAEGALERSIRILERGGLVAFPTDTVYGLGASAFDPRAVNRLYEAKGRSGSKAIPILVASLEQAELVVKEMDEQARELARRFWPGPLTIILHRRRSLPLDLSAKRTVGVRVPDHPIALALLEKAGPLAVTSANVSGQPNSRSANEVVANLGGKIDMILDGGESPGGRPSSIIDCTIDPIRIVRHGPLSEEEIMTTL
jgi:L-threonylcarbamoyladenylate synthase